MLTSCKSLLVEVKRNENWPKCQLPGINLCVDEYEEQDVSDLSN